MKIWNKCICLTSSKSLMVIGTLLISTLVIASAWTSVVPIVETPVEQVEVQLTEEVWIPTADDIAYQDSMYQIIQSTQSDISDIKKDIVHILERLDYEDGTYDSIRYVEGGVIDMRRN